MQKGGITKVNLQWFLHHQETPQNLISTAVLIFQVGIVVACMHNRRFQPRPQGFSLKKWVGWVEALYEPSEGNAAFCAKREMSSLRSADAFLVVASPFGGREATTGNASALRRLRDEGRRKK